MRKDLLFNITLAAAAYLLPLAGAPERYRHVEPWLALAAAVVTLFTQPTLTPQEMAARDTADRRSALWIFITMFAAQMLAVLDFGYVQEPTGWRALSTLGLSLTVAGLTFRIWSIRTLGRFFTSTVQVQEGQRVITAGPYRLLRHPSYAGALTAAIGTCLVLGSTAAALAVFALVVPAYIHRMRVEERELVSRLGEPYERYLRITRRLVPFIY